MIKVHNQMVLKKNINPVLREASEELSKSLSLPLKTSTRRAVNQWFGFSYRENNVLTALSLGSQYKRKLYDQKSSGLLNIHLTYELEMILKTCRRDWYLDCIKNIGISEHSWFYRIWVLS